MLHILLHFAIPALVGLIFFRPNHWRAILIMFATMIVDADHLLADPIYDPNRCSINFHLLHTYPFIAIYVAMLFFRPTRLVGLGLVIHMILDYLDCML